MNTERYFSLVGRDAIIKDQLNHSDKGPDRRRIAIQIDEFLRQGGEINCIDTGVSGMPINLSHRSVNDMTAKWIKRG